MIKFLSDLMQFYQIWSNLLQINPLQLRKKITFEFVKIKILIIESKTNKKKKTVFKREKTSVSPWISLKRRRLVNKWWRSGSFLFPTEPQNAIFLHPILEIRWFSRCLIYPKTKKTLLKELRRIWQPECQNFAKFYKIWKTHFTTNDSTFDKKLRIL